MSFNTSLLRRASVPAAAALVAAGLWAAPAAASPAMAPLAAADLTPSVEALPTVQIDKGTSGRDGGVVWSQVVVGNTVYVGGDFTTARPAGIRRGVSEVPRTYLLAYDITTGNLTSFNHTLNGQVRGVTASPDGRRVYITGDFTQVDGKNRTRVAAFNTADGSLVDGFRPVLGANGLAIAASNSTVYVGGNFTKVGQVAGGTLVARNRLAAFSATDGSVGSFKADANAPVTSLALTPAGNRLAVGGRFSTLSGATARGLGSVDPTTGSAQSFPVNQSIYSYGSLAAIQSLYADSTGIYGTSYVVSGGTSNFEGTFRADPGTGNLIWVADCYGDTYAAFQTGGVVWDTSHHHDCASMPGGFRDTGKFVHANAYTLEVAGTDTGGRGYSWNHKGKPTPRMLQWFPKFTTGYYTGMGQAAWSITGNSQYVSYGGEFQAVNNNKSQQGLVRFLVPGGGGVPGGGDGGNAGGGDGGGVVPVPGGFTVTADGLGVFVDASGLGAKTYWWDFGGGAVIGEAGSKVAYTYRAAGTYDIRLVATDAQGRSSTYVQQVTVAKDGGGAVGDKLAADDFARQAASGWGSAGQGGAWTPDTKPGYFSADGDRGLITIPTAGWTSQTRLGSLNQADVDVAVQAGVTKRPGTGMTRVWAAARTSSDFKSAYLLRANVNPAGQVESLQVIKRVAGAETVIGTVGSPGVTLGAADLAQLRLRVVGTTVQGKVWKAGATEPAAWQVQVTDASVKTAGSVSLGAYTGASATPLPVIVAFDNLTVTKAG